MRYLILICFSLFANTAISQTCVFQEDFNAGIPATWTIIDAGDTTGDSWTGTNGTAKVLYDDIEQYGVFVSEDLISPPFDGTPYISTGLYLEYDHTAYQSGLIGDDLNISVWNGSTWVILDNFEYSDNGTSTKYYNLTNLFSTQPVPLYRCHQHRLF